MSLFRSLADLPAVYQGGALSIGNFDGVHRGHAKLLGRLVARARDLGKPAVVLTFDPHPLAVLRPEFAPTPLSTPEEKYALLRGLGVDAVVVEPTTPALLNLSARDFFDSVVVERLRAKVVVEGENFAFGKGRAGTLGALGRWCREVGASLEVVPLAEDSVGEASSSAVRQALNEGDVERAADLLGRPYSVAGEVVHGAARGRLLGFPTANLERVATLLPAAGIYAGRASWEGNVYTAAVHLGPIPTFDDPVRRLEAFLLDFQGDLYGRTLNLAFLRRLRGILTFDGVEPLRKQLELDVEATRVAVAEYPVSGRAT